VLGVLLLSAGGAPWRHVSRATIALLAGIDESVAADLFLARAAAAVSLHRVAIIALLATPRLALAIAADAGLYAPSAEAFVTCPAARLFVTLYDSGLLQTCGRNQGTREEQRHALEHLENMFHIRVLSLALPYWESRFFKTRSGPRYWRWRR
jgi:hypothetical protein